MTDADGVPASARQREHILLRSLSGLLLKWREIVKVAQHSPDTAAYLFGIPPRGSSSPRRGQLNAEHRNGALAEVAGAPVQAARRESGDSSASANTDVALQDLMPSIAWIFKLQARQVIVPNGAASSTPQQRQVGGAEELLDDDLLGEIVTSMHTAFAGMKALLKAVQQRKEAALENRDKEEEEEEEYYRGGEERALAPHTGVANGGSTKTANNAGLLAMFATLFENDHRKLRDTLVEMQDHLLRRMSYIMTEVLHEFQGVKQGLRDSVELCAMQKMRIHRLSTELHGEDHTRSSVMTARGASSPRIPRRYGAVTPNNGAELSYGFSSQGSSPAVSHAQRGQQLFLHLWQPLLGSEEQQHTAQQPEAQRASNRGSSAAFSIGGWDVLVNGSSSNNNNINNEDEDRVLERTSSTCSSSVKSPAPLGFTISAEEGEQQDQQQLNNVVENNKSVLPTQRNSLDCQDLPPRPGLSPSLPRLHVTMSPLQVARTQAGLCSTYVVPHFGFSVEATEVGTLHPHVFLCVTKVEKESPAHEVGLSVGDVVAAIDDVDAFLSVAAWESFLARLSLRPPSTLRVKTAVKNDPASVSTVVMRVPSTSRSLTDKSDESNDECGDPLCTRSVEPLPVSGSSSAPLPCLSGSGSPLSPAPLQPAAAAAASMRTLLPTGAGSALAKTSGPQRGRVFRVTGRVIHWNEGQSPLIEEERSAVSRTAATSGAVSPSRPPPPHPSDV
ncbi:hypothetical protein DQ04_00891140 [Trypanosoma grayi]|uniref:hypothetical protein n=1 Tax=Trypanosoma grayi TaxID=71804 RepID=UPI0004F46467|nr:hypothetical protein DQ04_00891140 [Trypanosoma grayi]KEG13631.1 hypothetical protein DQ04_00891140 [Trypanosoma grayi]